MKKLFLSFLLASPSIFIQAQFDSNKDPYLTKSLSAEQFSKMDISTSHGNIRVEIADMTKSRVEVFIVGNGIGTSRLDKEEIQSRIDKYYDLSVMVQNGQLIAYAKTKKNTIVLKQGLSFSFRIYSPVAVPSHLSTSHGDIDLSGMNGEQELSTSHGNIQVTKVTGSVNGGTSHGNVSARNITKGVDLSTSHGNIQAEQCEGHIQLKTSDGNVMVSSVNGKISAHTSHGNIGGQEIGGELVAVTSHGDVSFTKVDAVVETSTSHGNITLQFARGKGINIDLQAKRIRVEPLENFSGSKGERSMKGTLNGGGALVSAGTSHGSVSLEFR